MAHEQVVECGPDPGREAGEDVDPGKDGDRDRVPPEHGVYVAKDDHDRDG